MNLNCDKDFHNYNNNYLGRKPIFTSGGNLRGGLSSWLIKIKATQWCGNRMSAHLATPRSHKFRTWKSLYYFSSY